MIIKKVSSFYFSKKSNSILEFLKIIKKKFKRLFANREREKKNNKINIL